MKWNKDFWNMSTHPYELLTQNDVFELPEPPSNTSAETRYELDYLLQLQASRTPENEAEIKSQLNISHLKFDCFQFSDLENTKLVYLPKMVQMVTLDLVGAIMRQKRKYDRVRAIYLDNRLKTVVPNPEHPAYPSGHSTEAHFYAHVFSHLNPGKRDVYFKNAKRIAENRELAGVHYPSDTKAGIMLGEQVFTAMMKNEKFRDVLKSASLEFKNNIKCPN